MASTPLFSVQYSSLKTQTSIPCCCRDSILIPAAASGIRFAYKNGTGKSGLEYFTRLALKKKKKNGGPGGGHMSEGRKSGGFSIRAAKRVVSARSFLMSTTLVAKEEEEEKVVELCRSITEWGQQKQKDRSFGVLQFGCFADLYGKHTYHFMERYSSFEHIVNFRILNQVTTTRMWNNCLHVRPLLTQPMALAVYEYENGQIGHMRTPMGPKGQGGLDDATGQAGIGGGVSHKQQSKPIQNTEILEKKDKGAWSLQKALQKMRGAKTKEYDNTVKNEK
uniref:Uncharacterized protein n=1 Tax=Picea sitchensis TaxID=3332 RepID=D5A984_PICSI|nr:unknown [Picea sitchensis]